MAKSKENEKDEKVLPVRCVCGATPVFVVFKGKTMYSCTNTTTCAMRSRRFKGEQDAAKEWNTMQEEAKYNQRRLARQKCKV